jgi:hypothetical protein
MLSSYRNGYNYPSSQLPESQHLQHQRTFYNPTSSNTSRSSYLPHSHYPSQPPHSSLNSSSSYSTQYQNPNDEISLHQLATSQSLKVTKTIITTMTIEQAHPPVEPIMPPPTLINSLRAESSIEIHRITSELKAEQGNHKKTKLELREAVEKLHEFDEAKMENAHLTTLLHQKEQTIIELNNKIIEMGNTIASQSTQIKNLNICVGNFNSQYQAISRTNTLRMESAPASTSSISSPFSTPTLSADNSPLQLTRSPSSHNFFRERMQSLIPDLPQPTVKGNTKKRKGDHKEENQVNLSNTPGF